MLILRKCQKRQFVLICTPAKTFNQIKIILITNDKITLSKLSFINLKGMELMFLI